MKDLALPPHFLGYARADGRAGVRNHLVVVATVALANRWAELVAAGTSALVVSGEFVRGLRTGDARRQEQVLLALATHPNVGACLVLCHDAASARAWQERMRGAPCAWQVLAFMDQHGMEGGVRAGREALEALEIERALCRRVPCPISALTVALECGGSDATSALVANPAIGRVVDALVRAGGGAIVSETAEFVGAEDAVRAQCPDPGVAGPILAAIAAAERRMEEDGERYRGVNPTAENIEAGLTTLVEKSMGAVAKVGREPFRGFLAFGARPGRSGLHFMDTPFFSPCSITGMVAGGAQLTLFAMGVFNPSGNPLAPTIKVCGNPATASRWNDSVDVDLSAVLAGSVNLDEAARRLAARAIETVQGSETCAEHWREGQFIVPKTLAPL